MNPGWKLGAVETGRAPEIVLASYHEERHPVGRRLLMNTRAQGLLILGRPEARPGGVTEGVHPHRFGCAIDCRSAAPKPPRPR